jgi:hypothetical protein
MLEPSSSAIVNDDATNLPPFTNTSSISNKETSSVAIVVDNLVPLTGVVYSLQLQAAQLTIYKRGRRANAKKSVSEASYKLTHEWSELGLDCLP